MEVKQGYKQTDVGVIPEEWELSPFVSLGNVIDGDRGTNYPGSKDFGSDGHCLFLNAGNVTKAGFRFEECAFISREKDERLSKGKLRRDDIVLTTRGTVGNFAHFNPAVPFEHIRINSGMVILRKDSASIDTTFLYALLQSHFVERQIERLTFGSAQPQLTVKGISKFAIVVPPLTEQRAIAEALSDVDGLLGGLDRLIAKKRDLKQAAMQQLLTGQTRLRGLVGRWQPWTISQISGHIIDYRGRTPLKLGMDWGGGDIPALSARNVKMGYIDFREETNFGSEALYQRWMTNGHARKGDIVITTEAPLGNVALIPDDRRYILSQRTLLLQVDPTIATSSFLMQTMMASHFQNLLSENSSGSTATGIQRKRFEKLELILPEVPEQIAIAEVLTEMDAELAALEQRREKTLALKRAMMQELLTGRTRLAPAGDSHA